jgi:hypothetical protein
MHVFSSTNYYMMLSHRRQASSSLFAPKTVRKQEREREREKGESERERRTDGGREGERGRESARAREDGADAM